MEPIPYFLICYFLTEFENRSDLFRHSFIDSPVFVNFFPLVYRIHRLLPKGRCSRSLGLRHGTDWALFGIILTAVSLPYGSTKGPCEGNLELEITSGPVSPLMDPPNSWNLGWLKLAEGWLILATPDMQPALNPASIWCLFVVSPIIALNRFWQNNHWQFLSAFHCGCRTLSLDPLLWFGWGSGLRSLQG